MKDKIKSKEEAIKASPLYGIKKPCKIVLNNKTTFYNYGEIGIEANRIFFPLAPEGSDLREFDFIYVEEEQYLCKKISAGQHSVEHLIDLKKGIVFSKVDGSSDFYMPMTDEEIEACTPWYVKLWNAYPAWSWYLGAILLVVAIILYAIF